MMKMLQNRIEIFVSAETLTRAITKCKTPDNVLPTFAGLKLSSSALTDNNSFLKVLMHRR